jgi:uncharacterized coiled-coil protein SlyX
VITIQSAMLVALGVFLAGLVTFLVLPFYGRRAARLATDALRRSMPLTEAEIRADKDRLRAEHAILLQRLETKLEDARLSGARQLVEINRRDAAISTLEGEVAEMKTLIEENENARRVLELTIMDRLPRVEERLAEAKKLLFQRDREIATLTQTSAKQVLALDEATQINTQQRDEIHRLNATLTTRAARNRDPILADSRFDEEVALRAELEALRAKTRDQAQLISRLQEGVAKGRSDGAHLPAVANGATQHDLAAEASGEPTRLRNDLIEAEIALKSARDAAEAGQAGQAVLMAELRTMRTQNQDLAAEVARLRAALKTYESEDADDKAVKESKIAMKARLSALEAQAAEHSATIHSLRAEVAAANEKLARQAAHYVAEMRRLGAGTLPASGAPRRATEDVAGKRTLSERIAEPRGSRRESTAGRGADAQPKPAATPEEAQRVNGFLRALDGASKSAGDEESGAGAPPSAEGTKQPQAEAAKPAGRRPGLIERLTGADKPAASR